MTTAARTTAEVGVSPTFESLEAFKAFVLTMCTERSGIDPLLCASSISFHQDVESSYGNDVVTPIHEALGWHFSRFGHQANEPLYAAFFCNEDGSVWQAIVSVWDKEKERPYRYFAPKDTGDRAFFPPIPKAIRARIGERYGVEVPEEGSFWEWIRTAPIPRIVSEGAKKALSALSEGYVAIALYGCSCGAKGKDSEGRHVSPYLIDDLTPFAQQESQWLLAFDRDEKVQAQRDVARGKKRLSRALCSLQCKVDDIEWKSTDGKGLDDLMVNQGQEAFEHVYALALQRLERQFAPLQQTKKISIPKADLVALQIAQDYVDTLLWNDAHRSWMYYALHQPGVWSAVNDHYIETVIQSILKARSIYGYGSDSYIVNIRKFLSRELVTFTWQEREGILPFEDGIVDIETKNFEAHSPQNRLTWCLPRKYETPAVSDWGSIRAWLEEAWSSDRELLLCFAAAVLRGRYDLQKFLYLVGSGGSGKGTYTRLLQTVLGERNTWAGKVEQLGDKNDCARLVGKRLAVFADQDKVTSGLQLFKNLTGQDDLTAKHLYKDGFNFIFKGLAVMSANAPALLGAGSWMKRRALVVNCTYQPAQERNLDVEFAPEIAAFTRYLLSIPLERIDQVLRDERPSSGTVSSAFWEMAQRQDSIAAWVEECVVCEEGVFTQVGNNKDEWQQREYNPELSTLFGSYSHFCRATGLQGKSLTNFAPELEELCQKVLGYKGVTRERNSTGVRGFRGIRLRRASELRISDNLMPLPDNGADNNHSDNQKSLYNKSSDNPDNLKEKNVVSAMKEKGEDVSSMPPSTTVRETIAQGCQGRQAKAQDEAPVRNVATDNLFSQGLSAPQHVEEEFKPGTWVLFCHEDFEGWRKGVIEELVCERGIFVRALVEGNVKRNGTWTKRTYKVCRADWLKREEACTF